MSFITSALSTIASAPSPHKEILQYLCTHAIGKSNAKSFNVIQAHLSGLAPSLTISQTTFQQTLLGDSRKTGTTYSNIFIASCATGYYMIDTIGDAEVARDFYENRIAAEESHLRNLRVISSTRGWSI